MLSRKLLFQHLRKLLDIIPGIVLLPEYAVGLGHRFASSHQRDTLHGGIKPHLLSDHVHRQIALSGDDHQPRFLQRIRKPVITVQTNDRLVVCLLLLPSVGVDDQNARYILQFLRLDLRKTAQGIPGRDLDKTMAFGQNEIVVCPGESPALIVECKVDGAILHGMIQVIMAADGHLHIDLGIFFGKPCNGLRKFAAVVALIAAQTKRVAVIRIQPLCLADKLLQITADDNALAVKVLPGRRETN